MPTFNYTARGATGELLQGAVNAATSNDAAKALRAEGKFVVKLVEAAARAEAKVVEVRIGGRRVKGDDVIFFASQMAVMVDTGVPITEALESIIEQTASPAFKRILQKVLDDVQGGTPLSLSMAKHPRAFKPLFVNLVKASEASGQLGALLDRIAGYLMSARDTRRKVVGALLYPAFLMLMSIGVVIFLLTYLMPKFTGIYAGKEELLPKPTKILIGFSQGLVDHALWWIPGSVALVLGLVFFFRSARGRRPLHWLVLRLPLVGKTMRKAMLVRSLRTLGTLVDSGVAMLDAVGITRVVAGNAYFEDMWDQADARVQQGEQLSAPLAQSRLMPRAVTQMISAGERSGQLGKVLDRVCGFLERDLEQTIKRMTLMIEPLMIFIMGGIVGSIVIALLLPIFTMSRVIAH